MVKSETVPDRIESDTKLSPRFKAVFVLKLHKHLGVIRRVEQQKVVKDVVRRLLPLPVEVLEGLGADGLGLLLDPHQ